MSATKLYLDLVAGDAAHSRALLAAALTAAPVASVLIRSPGAESPAIDTLRLLVKETQQKDIAALIAAPPRDAIKLGADGVHLLWSANVVRDFKAARADSAQLIIGADAGRSRHDAMEIGEAGADYVAFGIPEHVEDRARAAERQLNLIDWWSELFEVPSVAFDVPDAEAARRLAEAGADFVAVHLSPDDTPESAAARVREFSEALRIDEPVK